jgi:hypothetical protein
VTVFRDWRGTLALVLAGASLLLAAVAIVVAVAGAHLDVLPVQSAPEPASASQVEAVAHVTLPPGTVLLSAAYSNGLDTRLSAKFRMPRAAQDAFIASGGFTTALQPGLRAVTGTHNVGGGNLWDPQKAASVAGLQEQQPTSDGTLRAVMLDLDAPDSVTVYLYAGRA